MTNSSNALRNEIRTKKILNPSESAKSESLSPKNRLVSWDLTPKYLSARIEGSAVPRSRGDVSAAAAALGRRTV
ncbi:MAG: hypothetical protein OEQ29_07465 [Alphaproteobacteria bacterium]|nr:hypothetical protein [Alphaproteobacteria bacterium]